MKNHSVKRHTAVAFFVAAVSFIICLSILMNHLQDQSYEVVMMDQETEAIYLSEELEEDGIFSVSYSHSVNKSDVEEYYRLEDGQLTLIKAKYHGFGAGVATEVVDNQVLYYEDGFMVIDQMQVLIPDLVYRVGTVSNHILHVGEKTWQLKDFAPEQSRVVFEIVDK